MSLILCVLVGLLFLTLSFFEVFSTKIINNKIKISFYLFMLIILIFLSGFRPLSSNLDNLYYKNVYEMVPSINKIKDLLEIKQFEIGFMILNSVIKTLNVSYRGLFLFSSILSLSIKGMAFYKFCKYKWTALCVYYFIFFFTEEIIVMRFAIATGIIIYALKNLSNKKKYIVSILIASSFHSAALLSIIPLLIYKMDLIKNKLKRNLYLIISFFIGLIGPIKIIYIIAGEYLPYRLQFYFLEDVERGSYRKMLFFIPVYVFLSSYEKRLQKNIYFKESFIYYYSFLIITLLTMENHGFSRMGVTFLISLVIIFDIILKEFKRKYISWLFIILFSLFFVFWTLRGGYLVKFIV